MRGSTDGRRRSAVGGRWRRVGLVAAVALAGAVHAWPQDPAADPWGPLRLLEGTWEGEIDGRLGQGRGLRRYERAVGGQYLVMRQTSVRLPQEKSPQGDHHREMAVFSHDRVRERIVLREFFVEGYVVRSLCEVAPGRVVCASEDVESGPGMRSRLTLEIADAFGFEEVFELASPGEELRVYFTNRWRRIPDLAD